MPDYTAVVDSLEKRFAGAFSRAEVEAAVEEARQQLEPQSTVRDFLELLVERRARELLSTRPTTPSA
jgi:hypothetical protein